MGYGLPAAIGASVAANGSKPVIAVMGDGSFQMDLPEMGTMAQWDIPVKMVLFQTTVLVWYTNISIFFINQIIRLLK